MRPLFTQKEEVKTSKTKIKTLLKANAKLEDLDDLSLYVLALMAHKELGNRQSDYKFAGSYRDEQEV